jgi:outer membrane receptor protein involved in Fe transport
MKCLWVVMSFCCGVLGFVSSNAYSQEPEEQADGSAALDASEVPAPSVPAESSEVPAPSVAAESSEAADASEAAEGKKLFLDLSLEELLNLEVAIASMTKERISEAASSVTVFTKDDIARLGVRYVEQLLQFTPGLRTGRDMASIQRYDIRGFADMLGQNVLVMMDGIRLNGAVTGGTTGRASYIPTEGIERVEIIRGPGSALYGANAFLAVVDVTTRKDANSVKAGAGNIGGQTLDVNVSHIFGDVKVSGSASFYLDEGFEFKAVDAQGNHVTDPISYSIAKAAVQYKGFTLWGRFAHFRTNGFYNFNYTPAPYTNRAITRNGTVGLSHTHEFSEELNFDASLYVSAQKASHIGLAIPADTVLIPILPPLEVPYFYGRDSLEYDGGGDAKVVWRFLKGEVLEGTLTTGASAAYKGAYGITVTNYSSLVPPQYLGDTYALPEDYTWLPEHDRTVAGGFLQAKLGLWSQLELTLGARYDWYSDFGSAFSPRAALIYSTPFDSSIKVMYGRAFRAPALIDLYLDSADAKGNEDLKPENVDTIEAAYVQHIANYAQATVTYFYTLLTDKIVQEAISPYERAYANASGHIIYQGVEFELRTRDLYGFNLMGCYSHVLAKNEKDLTMPSDFGSVALNYSWAPISININSTINGKITDNPAGVDYTFDVPAYALLNAFLQVEAVNGIKAWAIVENLADLRVMTWSSAHTQLNAGLPIRGRTFLIGMSASM